MIQAWVIFWASFGRMFIVIDVATASLETAAKQGQSEVNNWATLNDESRDERLILARKVRADALAAKQIAAGSESE